MKIDEYAFQHLPFSRLFKTYTRNFQKLSDFYEVNPFDRSKIEDKLDQYTFSGNRERTAEVLSDFNAQFDVGPAVNDNIRRLKREEAVTLVTGQQLGIYGGPMYTFLKALSTIHLARQLEQEFNKPVIPVFWLADEDHDYDEIRSLQLPDQGHMVNLELPPRPSALPPVSELPLPEELSGLRDQVRDKLLKTSYKDELWALLDSCFTPGKSFLKASGQFMSSLFSKHGLVLAGSNLSPVKQMARHCLKHSIAEADQIRANLNQQTSAISKEFHQQVHLYDSNLFYLEREKGRTKINRNGSGWNTATGKHWQTEELVREIEDHPEFFSPNVFLRPILQDILLPTVGYVAGPGETSYYGQMKEMYASFNLEMPAIFPRLSATLIEPAIERISKELPFSFHEYSHRIEDLETAYVDRTERTDIPALFDEWKQKTKAIVDERRKKIADIDSTLEKSVGKTSAQYFNELDKLQTKVYRAVKKRDQIQLNRVHRIKANWFPGRNMQERSMPGIFYMNKYGLDIWDYILEELDKNERFDQHKLIYL